MPEKESTASMKERAQTKQLIEELLTERNQVWTLYCKVAGVEPYQSDKPLTEQIQEFCQLLVDYISLGHFSIYQRLTNASEQRKSILASAEQIYPQIVQTTEAALGFNEKYQAAAMPSEGITDDLSALGNQLANRIELEDELISKMLV
ncbi:MAG: Rsd/AlgQ family anti-sigma factor [Methyloprofundus sp.]|nr:Rsd/AlgQ family anti-sigma factor [Methyloprofundus sp.]